MLIVLDPSMMMSARVGEWLQRLDADAPVAAVAASLVDDAAQLGLFAGVGMWSARRRLHARPRAVDYELVHATAGLIQACRAGRGPLMFGLDGAPCRRDASVAAQLWEAMVDGAWVMARRAPLWDLLVSSGVELRMRPAYLATMEEGAGTGLRQRASEDVEREWFAPLCAALSPNLCEALVRRTRFFARAIEPHRAAAALSAVGGGRVEFERDRFAGSVVEVFDAGPPSRQSWR